MIDDLLDRLERTLRAKGLPVLGPSTDVDGLAAAIADVAPLVFPRDVLRFWERVDPLSIAPSTFPPLMPPSAGIVLREQNSQTPGPGLFPRNLYPLCYESWEFLFVELPTGELWSWGYGASCFVLSHRGLDDLLQALITTVSEGAFKRSGEHVFIDVVRLREISARKLAEHGQHPRYADGEVPTSSTSWPDHWLLASGVTARARHLRGATHTIAQLLGDDVADGTTATIAATVHGLGGNPELGYGLHVSDGTGEMRLHSPAAAHTVTSPSVFARFEFDIVLRREPERDDPPDDDPAVQQVLDSWERGWAGGTRAVATGVRFIENVVLDA